jgi:hypothetical protein
MTYPYPPVPQPPAPEPRRSWPARHKILTGLGALLLLFVVIAVASGGGGSKPAPAPSKTPSTSPTPTPTDSKTPTATPPTAPTSAPAPAVAEYSDGDYVVGEDIPAGTYTSEGATPGLFELCMISTEGDSGDNWGQLKSANANERIIITLDASDGVVTLSGCEPLKAR